MGVLYWEVRLVKASQTSFLDRHLPHGFWSSHFAFAEAHASHALAARSLRLMKGLDFLAFRSWVASWRVNRSLYMLDSKSAQTQTQSHSHDVANSGSAGWNFRQGPSVATWFHEWGPNTGIPHARLNLFGHLVH